ncbi:MAG: hypothetical protein ACI92Z_001319 [Paracoccaceae bacterium]|jgi:hypothetical protein
MGPDWFWDPADYGGILGDIGTHSGEDFVQAIERKMVVEFRDENVGQKAGAGHAARDRTAGGLKVTHMIRKQQFQQPHVAVQTIFLLAA